MTMVMSYIGSGLKFTRATTSRVRAPVLPPVYLKQTLEREGQAALYCHPDFGPAQRYGKETSLIFCMLLFFLRCMSAYLEY
jgi:hypothetical protein